MLAKIALFFLGTCIGSFLNVCIYRLPKDISIINPSSFCPKCKKPLKWYENIPLFSFILLKGECSKCKEKISYRYPLVEFITGLIFLILYLKFGLSLELFKFIFFFSLLIVVSFIDIDYHAIPFYLCIFGILVGLVFSGIETFIFIKTEGLKILELPILNTFKGLFFGLGFVYFCKIFGDLFMAIYLYLRKKESIEGERESLGLGDVDFMGLVGTFLGIQSAILTFIIAPFIAIFYSIFAIIFKRSHLIPYLPYLSLATTLVFFWKELILKILGFSF